MSPEAFTVALWNAQRQRSDSIDNVWRPEEADALSRRARAALRGLLSHRTLNGIRSVGPRDYALARSVRRCGDAQEICSAVRECIAADMQTHGRGGTRTTPVPPRA